MQTNSEQSFFSSTFGKNQDVYQVYIEASHIQIAVDFESE